MFSIEDHGIGTGLAALLGRGKVQVDHFDELLPHRAEESFLTAFVEALQGPQEIVAGLQALGGTTWNKGKRHPTLGGGVFICAGAKILGDIRIGDAARIGANSVVIREVPAGRTAIGIPARLVGESAAKVGAGATAGAALNLDHHLIPDPVGSQAEVHFRRVCLNGKNQISCCRPIEALTLWAEQNDRNHRAVVGTFVFNMPPLPIGTSSGRSGHEAEVLVLQPRRLLRPNSRRIASADFQYRTL